MRDFYEENDSTTTTLSKVTFIDFIVNNGYYRDFLTYCQRFPQVKSRKRLAVMFLRHIGKYKIASKFVYFRINGTYKDVAEVTWL